MQRVRTNSPSRRMHACMHAVCITVCVYVQVDGLRSVRMHAYAYACMYKSVCMRVCRSLLACVYLQIDGLRRAVRRTKEHRHRPSMDGVPVSMYIRT